MTKKSVVFALLAAAILLCCSSCKKEPPVLASATVMEKYSSDAAYIRDKRALIVGVTDYRPLDWLENGMWKGFDAELAAKFAESIGVQVFFREINWSDKVELLENGTIDCIWNGMTRTDELIKAVSCSRPYLVNSQVIVLPAEKAGVYKHESECSNLLFTLESGSTAEKLLKKLDWRYVVTKSQIESLEQVASFRADAAIIDSIMAAELATVSKQLVISFRLNYEQICVALRASSDLMESLNLFLQQSEVDGTIGKLKAKYGIE